MDIVTLVKHYIPSETPAVVFPIRKECEQILKWPKRNCTMHAFSFICNQIPCAQNTNTTRVREMCQSCQTWPAKFGQILPRTDTNLVFCNRKLMRTDILFTRTTKPSCNFENSALHFIKYLMYVYLLIKVNRRLLQ